MSTCQVGYGSITFGSVFAGVFRQEDGIQMDNGTSTVANCTSDSDTNMVWEAGDLVDYGQVKATLLIEKGVDVNDSIGTTETLTVTSPDGDTHSGAAILVSAPSNSLPNTPYTANCTFRWKDKPTFTAAP